MKYLFIVRNPSFFFQYEHVIKNLCDHNHHIYFLLNSRIWRNAGVDQAKLSEYAHTSKGRFRVLDAVKASGYPHKINQHKRELLNYAAYVRARNPISISPYMIQRSGKSLYNPVKSVAPSRVFSEYILKYIDLNFFNLIERAIPPDKNILNCIQRIGPDMVVASPYIFSRSEEIEYIKAAKKEPWAKFSLRSNTAPSA